MDRLDREEREAATTASDAVEPSQVVACLRDLPETWRRAEGGRGRRMLAEALFSRIKARGFREIEFELTENAAALGLGAAVPAEGLELRISGYGRGERDCPATTDLPTIMRLAEPPEPCEWLRSA